MKPAPIDLEHQLLGAILCKPAMFDEVSIQIGESDFAAEHTRLIYRAIVRRITDCQPVDPLLVAETLEDMGDLETVGGLPALIEMCQAGFAPANAPAYARGIRNAAIERRLFQAASQIMEITGGFGEAHEKLEKANTLLAGVSEHHHNSGMKTAKECLRDLTETLQERLDRGGDVLGLKSPWESLDRITNGFGEGDLIIVAGRPGMGKSVFTQNVSEHAALAGKSVLIASLEMSQGQIMERTMASLGRLPLNRIRCADLSEEEWRRYTVRNAQVSESALFIDDTPNLSVADLGARCRKLQRESGLDLVVVDYLQLMAGEGESETHRITTISRGLKLLARELGIPLIVVSQLNRSLEQRSDKRPVMADLRQSGAIEQDADMILCLYRDEVYDEESEAKGIAEVLIRKHRNGEIGTVPLTFFGEFCRFDGYAGPWPLKKKELPPMRANYSKGFE